MKKITGYAVVAIVGALMGASTIIVYNRITARSNRFVQSVIAAKKYEQAKAKASAAMWYADHLALSGLRLDNYLDTSAGYSGHIFISGVVRNNGDRTVSAVYLSCALIDDDGKPFYRIDANTAKTIEPGYAVNFIAMDSSPAIVPNWTRQNYRVEIVGIELED